MTLPSKQLPFWHRSNKMGALAINQLLSFSSFSDTDSLFGYGISTVYYPSIAKQSFIQVGFLRKRMYNYELKVGRWEKQVTSESNLSAGSLIRGNNAIPIPQITIRFPSYKKFQIFNHDFWIKGGFSHGWFSKGNYVKAPLLHEKYLYIRKPYKNGSTISVGLVHEAIWGGSTNAYSQQPHTFLDFIRVFAAQPASSSGLTGEKVNTLGNHLGIWDISYTNNYINRDFKFYYQHPFEDKSGAFQHFFDELKARRIPFKSFDGLWGIEIVNKTSGLFKQFLFEYLNTMYQSGPQAATDSTYGMDNYYNHYIYRSGWTYKNRVISNPLFTLGTHPDNDFNGVYIINNRIKSYHLGLIGNFFKNINYKLLLNYSKNYGTYGEQSRYSIQNIPYDFNEGINQFSALLEIDINNLWNNLNLKISYAIDRGKLLGDSEGYLISFIYNFSDLSRSH